MRILHVSDCFPPRLGGIETQVETLVSEQRGRGHVVHVLTLTNGPEGELITRLKAHFQKSLLVRFGSTRDIGVVYEEFRPDVIHIHIGSGAWLGWAAVKFAKRNNIPAVLSIHSIWGRFANFTYTKWLTETPRFRFVTVSQQARNSLQTGAQGVVIANGLSVHEWQGQSPKKETITFITASRLVKRKRLIELVEMFARLHKRHPQNSFQLRIAGDGPLKKRIQRMLQSHDQEYVKLLGRLTKVELQEEFASAHAYIQLSKLEAFGLAAAEAQASGLGVIGLRASGISDFVTHKVDGFLGESDTQIEAFLDTSIDEPLVLQNLRDNVDVNSKPYLWSLVLEKYDSLYVSVTSGQ